MIAELLAGGGLTALGFALGRLPSRRRGPRPVRPVCGCDHHHAFHDPGTGQCHALMDGDAVKHDSFGRPTDWAQVPCTCKQYSGPVPLGDGYFAPELARGD